MPTITFSEFLIGTINPTYTFADTVVRTTGVIVRDGAQPASPAIAANSNYLGPVFIYFDDAVTSASLAVGYFNDIASTRIEFRDEAGRVIQAFQNAGLGVITYSLEHADGIASIAIIDQRFDEAGFSVDTVSFGPVVPDLPPPTVDRLSGVLAVDRNFGSVQGGSSFWFSDAVGDTDQNDFISLTVSAATQARIRVYLNNNPDEVREVTIDLVEGNNTLRIRADQSYGDLEEYSIVVEVADFADPDQQLIDDLMADLLGTVFSYEEMQLKIFDHLERNINSVDEAAGLLGRVGSAFGIFGRVLDFSNRIDNVLSASDWRKQAAIEIGDAFLGLALTGGALYGVSFVGGPLAGVIASGATGVVYTFGLSEYVKDEIGQSYDAYRRGENLSVPNIELADVFTTPEATNFSHLIFDEQWYVANHSAAAAAVASGAAVSGFAYYLTTGIALGHSINAGGTVVGASELASGVRIIDAGDTVDPFLGSRALGIRAGDLLNVGEIALVNYINTEVRTEGTGLALNAALSAIANRIALDATLNRGELINVAILNGGSDWAATLSNGQAYKTFFASLATAAGIDMGQTALFASWNGGDTPEEVYANLATSINAPSLLVGLASQSIGIAQVGDLWIVLVTSQRLTNDGFATDSSFLSQAGDASNQDMLGGEGRDLINGFAGEDRLWGRGGYDTLLGGEGNDTLHGGEGSDRILGGDGDDTLIGDGFAAAPPNDPGDTLVDITLGGSGFQTVGQSIVNQLDAPVAIDTAWSLADDPNIADSSRRPHITLNITASGELYESFSFTGRAGQTFIFDVDGVRNAGSVVDSFLELRDATGSIIASDDDSSTSDGAGGSTSGLDPYLSYTFSADGTYTITLRPYYSGNFVAGTTAQLSISLDNLRILPPVETNPNADTILGGLGDDMILGEAGNDALYGEEGNDTLYGDEGNDTIVGGEGFSMLFGGAGDDVILVGSDNLQSILDLFAL